MFIVRLILRERALCLSMSHVLIEEFTAHYECRGSLKITGTISSWLIQSFQVILLANNMMISFSHLPNKEKERSQSFIKK